MTTDIRITYENWSLSKGDVHKCVLVKRITTTESYEIPNLDEIVDEERAVLFESETVQPCNIHVEFPPSCYVHSVTIVTDCQTLELFTGNIDEYYKTYYGELIDEFEGSLIFRFDVQISNSILSRFNLKFIPKDIALWIYGIQVAIKPNLKVLSNSLQPKIDFNNVQSILTESKHELTPNAEKCKEFLRSYANSKQSSGPPNLESIMSMMNGNLLGNQLLKMAPSNSMISSENAGSNENSNNNTNAVKKGNEDNTDSGDIYFRITNYVDNKLEEMEKRIQVRLDELERKQNVKLDKILELLSKRDV